MAPLMFIIVMAIWRGASSVLEPWAFKKTRFPAKELTPKAIIHTYLQQVLRRPDVTQSGHLEYVTWENADGYCASVNILGVSYSAPDDTYDSALAAEQAAAGAAIRHLHDDIEAYRMASNRRQDNELCSVCGWVRRMHARGRFCSAHESDVVAPSVSSSSSSPSLSGMSHAIVPK